MGVNSFYVKLCALVGDIRRQYVSKGDDFGNFNEHAIIWRISEPNLNLQYFICSLGGYFNEVISSYFMDSKLVKFSRICYSTYFIMLLMISPRNLLLTLEMNLLFDISYPMALLFLCTRLWRSSFTNFFPNHRFYGCWSIDSRKIMIRQYVIIVVH